jgi:hypothetical protein
MAAGVLCGRDEEKTHGGIAAPGQSTAVGARIAAVREGVDGSDKNRSSGIEIVTRLADGDLARCWGWPRTSSVIAST